MSSLNVSICGVEFKNPVLTASGTFGSGKEYSEFIDLNLLGGIIVKGVSNKKWLGNPPPRIAETYGGMINAVGLQNPGVDAFIKTDLPFLNKFDTNVIVNVCGHTIPEYVEVVDKLADTEIDMLELNISCPNLSEGGLAFGTSTQSVTEVVSEVKKHAKQPLIVKLSPNVTDICEIARAAEAAGADGLSLINTILAMQIDIHKRRPVLGNTVGGLSGPAIKPVAVRMVYQVHKAVKIPIIGMGGIVSGDDAVEFLMAGASAVAVGTASFANPYATEEVIKGIERYMDRYNMNDIKEILPI